MNGFRCLGRFSIHAADLLESCSLGLCGLGFRSASRDARISKLSFDLDSCSSDLKVEFLSDPRAAPLGRVLDALL